MPVKAASTRSAKAIARGHAFPEVDRATAVVFCRRFSIFLGRAADQLPSVAARSCDHAELRQSTESRRKTKMSKMNAEKRNSRSRKLFDNWMRLVVSTWIKTRTYQIHLSAALFLT